MNETNMAARVTKHTTAATHSGGDTTHKFGAAKAGTKQYKRLTAEEEYELGESIQAGNVEARNKLVEHHMGLVYSEVRKAMQKAGDIKGVSQEDLEQEATLGLITAAERFDHTKGTRFSTIATLWIKKAISDYIAQESSAGSVPAGSAGLLRRIKTKATRERRDLGEVARESGISEQTITKYMAATTGSSSLNDSPLDGTDNSYDDATPAPANISMEDMVANSMLRDILLQAMREVLTPKEQHVISMRTGLADGQPKTAKQISEEFKMTRSSVATIEKRATQKLLNSSLCSTLKDMFTDSEK